MPAQQRTFDLIPTTLVKSNVHHPPTTSKAAKKAYQQANKGPRISRAEQRRRDAAELERQKKEWERERAAAKAKAAREKKAAKANAEREERKRMGLPEPSKFVRASQPTISRFVKSESGKRNWQQIEMDCVKEESDDTMMEGAVEVRNEQEPPAKKFAIQEESEDEFGDFPSLSQTDILEKIDSSMLAAKVIQEVASPAHPTVQERVSLHGSPELPKRKVIEDERLLDDSQGFADMATTQLLSEAAEASLKSDAIEPQVRLDQPAQFDSPNEPVTTHQFYDTPVERRTVNSQGHRTLYTINKPALQARSINMPPPNLPLRRSINSAPEPPKPVHPPPAALARSTLSIPPSSTQAFLEAHIDDFFPSPTQQVRELLDDIDEYDLPSNTQIAKEISPERVSVIELQEPVPPSILKPVFNDVDDFENLLCTQDLAFSSQELAEIITPSRPPPALEHLISKLQPEPPKPRRPYFEEKEEDRRPRSAHSMDLSSNRVLEPNTEPPKPKRPFFQEKEEDLVRAAIHESKREEEQRAQRHMDIWTPKSSALGDPPKQEPQRATTRAPRQQGRLLSREEPQKVMAKAAKDSQKFPLGEEPKTSKRTLTRVQSTATDYGDDDFTGCSQELLAIC